MPRTRIKICGVTHPDDARLAADAGADAVGFVLHAPGRRREIDLGRAVEIVAALPPFVAAVGLFVDADAHAIRHAASHLRLAHVQLHGRESADVVRQLAGVSVVKVVRAGPDFDLGVRDWAAASASLPNLAALLFDAGSGGGGHPNNWDAVRAAIDGRPGLPPIVLAGGLTPENVGGVVRRLRPYAVDVSSGVEGDAYGRKDAGKVRAFVEAVRAADADVS